MRKAFPFFFLVLPRKKRVGAASRVGDREGSSCESDIYIVDLLRQDELAGR